MLLSVLGPKELLRENVCPETSTDCGNLPPSPTGTPTGASTRRVGLAPEFVRAEGLGGLLLRLGEVLSDDLSGLRGDPVGEVDGKLHDEVTALGRVLGERQAFAPEPLHHPRLDDVVAGEGDDAVFQCGNANSAATQSLEERRTGLAPERPKLWTRQRLHVPLSCHQPAVDYC